MIFIFSWRGTRGEAWVVKQERKKKREKARFFFLKKKGVLGYDGNLKIFPQSQTQGERIVYGKRRCSWCCCVDLWGRNRVVRRVWIGLIWSGEMGRDGYIVPADPQAAMKKKTASRNWIMMDCSGDKTVLDVDKYAIMHRVQIHARDLRILDPLLSYPSTILGRERAIVLNLEVYSFSLFWIVSSFTLLESNILFLVVFFSLFMGVSAYQGYHHCWRGLLFESMFRFLCLIII